MNRNKLAWLAGVLLALGMGIGHAAPKWVKASSSVNNALAGGTENGKPLYICRAAHGGGTHSGKVVGNNCNIGYGGSEISLATFELLTGVDKEIAWIASKNGETVKSAMAGGSEGGKTQSVCRFSKGGTTHPGKVVGTTCNIGYGGSEVTSSSYDVLTEVGSDAGTTTTTTTATTAALTDKLTSGQRMTVGGSLTSANGKYKLVYQSDGKLILYDSANKSIWAATTPSFKAHGVEMNTDGRMILRGMVDSKGNLLLPAWSTPTELNPNSYAQVTDDGRLVIFTKEGVETWASAVNPNRVSGNQLLSGQSIYSNQKLVSPNKKYELKAQPNGALVLYQDGKAIWEDSKNHLLEASGDGVRLSMQTDGNLVMYGSSGGTVQSQWATKTVGNTGATASLSDDGNLTVKGRSGNILFAAFLEPLNGGTLAAGSVLGGYQKLYSANKAYYLYLGMKQKLNVLDSAGKIFTSIDWDTDVDDVKLEKSGKVFGLKGYRNDPLKNSIMILKDDGELVIREPGGYDVWSSKADKAFKRLLPGQVLVGKNSLQSENGEYALLAQGDGKLVIVAKAGNTVWTRDAKYKSDKVPPYAVMQKDGNFVMYTHLGAGWDTATNSSANEGAYAVVTDEGKLLIKNKSDVQIWPKK
jgi:hypothetical protein